MDFELHHKENFGSRLLNDPIILDSCRLTLIQIWLCCFSQHRENHMLQGDDRVIWGNLFRVLVVLVVVMLALIVLANVLA